jgi:hypothetical protein
VSEAAEREERQLALIAEGLEGYRRGAMSLRALCRHLEALLPELRLVPPEWVDEVKAEVNGLDVLYAVAVDQGVADDLPDDYRAEVSETIRRLEGMLKRLPPLDDGAL